MQLGGFKGALACYGEVSLVEARSTVRQHPVALRFPSHGGWTTQTAVSSLRSYLKDIIDTSFPALHDPALKAVNHQVVCRMVRKQMPLLAAGLRPYASDEQVAQVPFVTHSCITHAIACCTSLHDIHASRV